MNLFSKNEPEVKTINDRVYKLRKWNTSTTILTGKKLLLAIAPAFGAFADNRKKPDLDIFSLEEDQGSMAFTAAAYQLGEHITDELFMETLDKLLSGLECDGKVIEDWDTHFDTYGEDLDIVLGWSLKENLWGFFMKSSMFRSKVGMIQTEAKQFLDSLKKEKKEDGNTK